MVAMFARTPLASERLAPHPGPAGRPGPAPAARRSRGLTTLAAAAGCGPPRGDAPSVRGEQAVLAEQRLEPPESLQVLGAETIMEAAQVALHLRLAPAGTRLAAAAPRQRGGPRGERGFEEGAELGLHPWLERGAHDPGGVDERQPGPPEPARARAERAPDD